MEKQEMYLRSAFGLCGWNMQQIEKQGVNDFPKLKRRMDDILTNLRMANYIMTERGATDAQKKRYSDIKAAFLELQVQYGVSYDKDDY